MIDRLARHLFAVIALLAIQACGGGSSPLGTSSFSTPTVPPTSTPTTPPAGALTLSQSSVALNGPGQSAPITAAEAAYSGPISVNASGCGAIASVTPASTTSSPAQFTVAAQAAGACALIFTDQFGQSASLSIGVTVTKATIQ